MLYVSSDCLQLSNGLGKPDNRVHYFGGSGQRSSSGFPQDSSQARTRDALPGVDFRFRSSIGFRLDGGGEAHS